MNKLLTAYEPFLFSYLLNVFTFLQRKQRKTIPFSILIFRYYHYSYRKFTRNYSFKSLSKYALFLNSILDLSLILSTVRQLKNSFFVILQWLIFTVFWIKARTSYFTNNWIYTTNHKRIAINYFWFVILAGIVGMVLATIIRLEFAYPGVGVLAGDSIQYLSLSSAHGVIMVFFMIMPLLFGAFANFLLPTQLGVHDVAFPRLNSAAFWFLPGGLLMLCQLVCVDRRYQRMNCFNIREVESLLKRRFFVDLINSKDHHLLFNKTAIALRYKVNNDSIVNNNLNLMYNYGLDFSGQTRNQTFTKKMSLFFNSDVSSYDNVLTYRNSSKIYQFIEYFNTNNIFFIFNSIVSKILEANRVIYTMRVENIFDELFSIYLSVKNFFFFIFSPFYAIIMSFYYIGIYASHWLNYFKTGFKLFSLDVWTFFNVFNYYFPIRNLKVFGNFLFKQTCKSLATLRNFLINFDFNGLWSETVNLFWATVEQIKNFFKIQNEFYIAFSKSQMSKQTDNRFFFNYAPFIKESIFVQLIIIWHISLNNFKDCITFDKNFYRLKKIGNIKNVEYKITQNPNVKESSWALLVKTSLKPFIYDSFWFELYSIWYLFCNLPVFAFNIFLYLFSDHFWTMSGTVIKTDFLFWIYNSVLETSVWEKEFTDKHYNELKNYLLNSVFTETNINLYCQKYMFIANFFNNVVKYVWSTILGLSIRIAVQSLHFYMYCDDFYFDLTTQWEYAYLRSDFYWARVDLIKAGENGFNFLSNKIDSFFVFPKKIINKFSSNRFFSTSTKETFLVSNEEHSNNSRFVRFTNPVFKYDYKSGDYFPKLYKENYNFLFPSILDLTSGLRTPSWFYSILLNELLESSLLVTLSNLEKKNIFTNFTILPIRINKIASSDAFYNFFFSLNSNNENLNLKWISTNSLNTKFNRMFLTSSMQQRLYNNWRSLKFTREAWRCKMLLSRHQKTLFRRYMHEDGVFWSIERNAKDLIPGWAMITPFSSRTRYTAVGKTDIGLMGVLLVLNSSIISGANFLVTYRYLSTLNNRKMRDARAFFTESIMVASWMMILANPMLVIGIIMLISDRHWQTSFFDYSGGGDTVLFQHMFWFFGHPEVYIIIIPTFGFTNTMMSYYLKKRVSARASLLYSLYTIAFLGFFVWGHHMYMVGLSHTTRMLFSTLTVMISVPAATKIMHWCVTTANSSFAMELPLLLTFSFIFFFTSGGISGMCVAHTGMDVLFHDTFYVIGHFHVMLAAGAMFASFGAFYFYFPAIFGVKYSRIYAYLHYTYYLIGQLMTVIPMLWLGYAGMPRRVLDYPAAFGGWHSVISAGHMLNVAGLIAFFIMIFDSLRQGRAATRNTFGISRYNTCLNFYVYEIARLIYVQQKSLFLFKLTRVSDLKLNNLNYTNFEPYETVLFSYYLIKKN